MAASTTNKDIYDDGSYRLDVPPKKRTNVLLVRPVLGKVKPTTYTLPGCSFTYGKRDQFDEEGVREVVGSWKQHTPCPASEPGRDFKKLNKCAVVAGATSSKHISDFRLQVDIRCQTLNTGPRNKHDQIPDMVFGRPQKPSTPIAGVLSNSYQRDWLVDQKQQKLKTHQQKLNLHTKALSQHTRASLGHQKIRAGPSKEPFKMQKFQGVEARVNSFPNNRPQDLQSNHQDESVAASTTAQPIAINNNSEVLTVHEDNNQLPLAAPQ